MRIQKGLGTLLPAFQMLNDTDRAALRASGSLAVLAKGERLIRAGALVDSVAFVHSGWVALEVRNISVMLLRPGEAYMNSFYLDERRAAVEVRAMSSASVALLDRRALKSVLARSPDLLFAIFERAVVRMDLLYVAQAKLGTDPLEVRLAWLLWTLGQPAPHGARRLPEEVPQNVLAGMLGASREEINRKRRMLMRAGFLSVDESGTRLDASTALLLGAHDYPV